MAEGQNAGLTFLSGPVFTRARAEQTADGCRVAWQNGTGASIKDCRELRLRGDYSQGEARLSYSADGKAWSDTTQRIAMRFGAWKGARFPARTAWATVFEKPESMTTIPFWVEGAR